MERLPEVRGKLTPGRGLAEMSWLRVGGPAEVFFQPADEEDLAAFLRACPRDVPVFPVGVCSNLIIREGGIPGVVIRLGRAFAGIHVEDGLVRVGSAALDRRVATTAAEAGIDLSFLRTIPGTIGGAVVMNAGCYGTYTADVFLNARAMDRHGEIITLTGADMGFAYRSSRLPEGLILLEATFRGPQRPVEEIESRMEEIVQKRAASQPVDDRSCGSTFRNPAGFSSTGQADDVHDMKAWKLIEDAGLRGFSLGGAQMSPKHANFLVNKGDASATELEELGELVRKRVFEHSGVRLEWEIMRVGEWPSPS
ncbi:UDP-N-acetylmuramate dehydrogenase [Algicella marina]|uniref:UDP-N-acetylenolpyruvoylglucosamine reductase n=1 Tax=Algicella marina TaxID=2683284 RepID=A0A6P1T5E2_9RHOB|nr:UDP-N-acetylmuramate dehydrogenase [Algicella marina]QHQ37257.1 UDP-N-acetylmuramate dehydrogenase [Algicella marina]